MIFRKLRARSADTGQAAETQGNNEQALRQLIAENRQSPDIDREIRIRDMRLSEELTDIPYTTGGSFPRRDAPANDPAAVLRHEQQLPTCDLANVTPDVLRAAFAEAGCLYVPGAISSEEAENMRQAVDMAHTTFENGTPDPAWNNPPKIRGRERAFSLGGGRDLAHKAGGQLAVDAPRAMFKACDLLERAGIFELAKNYHGGEQPYFAANKLMMYRVSGDGPEAGWHQDGRFLADKHDIKALNIWTALTDCGEDAPGMELVLEDLDHYVMPAQDSHYNWSVTDKQVDELFRNRQVPVIIPQFKAGDMLMFDEWILHRTSRLPGMTKMRYALESWFFAASAFPGGRIPMLP